MSEPKEFVFEKVQRLTAALNARNEAEVYEAFGLEAPGRTVVCTDEEVRAALSLKRPTTEPQN